jgi:N-hydroxyarylamine O-acetyltransferase
MPDNRLGAYLERIGYDGTVEPTLETLRGMHRAHFLHVPFENLDIQRRVPIVVDPEAIFEKVVTRRRGGFCLELSGLFAWALREIGFEVDVHGGRMIMPDGVLGEPLSHMTVVVHLDEPWVADVGFGGRLGYPLRMSERQPQSAGFRTSVVSNDGDHWFVSSVDPWLAPQAPRTYTFIRQPRPFEEFEAVCDWLQNSPDSGFTKGDVVTLGSDEGRTTYAGGRLLIARPEQREEVAVPKEDFPAVLEKHFGMRL